jgi:hypothetical protein
MRGTLASIGPEAYRRVQIANGAALNTAVSPLCFGHILPFLAEFPRGVLWAHDTEPLRFFV